MSEGREEIGFGAAEVAEGVEDGSADASSALVVFEQRDQICFQRGELEAADEAQRLIADEGVRAPEHVFRGFSQQRRDLLLIELRALRDELFGDGGAGFFVGEERLEGFADAGLGGELGEAEEFLVIRGAVELREQFGDARGAGLRLQRERGEHAGLDGQFRRGFGVEELRDDIGMTLQEHADEEALELAVVGLAHGDLLRAAGGLDDGAVGEARFGVCEQLAKCRSG